MYSLYIPKPCNSKGLQSLITFQGPALKAPSAAPSRLLSRCGPRLLEVRYLLTNHLQTHVMWV